MSLSAKEIEMLQRARKSNGGGVRDNAYAKALVKRLRDQGFITQKRGSSVLIDGALLYVITPGGREALERVESKEEALDAAAREEMQGPTIQLDGAPWD